MSREWLIWVRREREGFISRVDSLKYGSDRVAFLEDLLRWLRREDMHGMWRSPFDLDKWQRRVQSNFAVTEPEREELKQQLKALRFGPSPEIAEASIAVGNTKLTRA
jgi:hypothetical protein